MHFCGNQISFSYFSEEGKCSFSIVNSFRFKEGIDFMKSFAPDWRVSTLKGKKQNVPCLSMMPPLMTIFITLWHCLVEIWLLHALNVHIDFMPIKPAIQGALLRKYFKGSWKFTFYQSPPLYHSWVGYILYIQYIQSLINQQLLLKKTILHI